MSDSTDRPHSPRRTYLASAAGLLAGLAGCAATDTSHTQTTTSSTPTQTTTTTTTQTETTSTTTAPPGPGARNTIYVSPDGDDTATGARDDPLASIQTALEWATPGDTIHALPGEYHEAVRTVRSGTPDNPITLTGPPEAVFRGNPAADYSYGFHIEHSHIHLRGLTFNGLHDPSNPDSPDSYLKSLVTARHTDQSPDGYHQNLVIKPHAVGNTLRPFIHVLYSEHVEIGEFRVIGPAGLAMLKFGADNHNGEIVYVGTPPSSLTDGGSSTHFDGEPDRTNHVHVHHIDNTAGHPHAELVDVKPGAHHVLIEYCTDAGGAARYTLPGAPATSEAAIHVGGRENTVRWNIIKDSNGQGMIIGAWGAVHPERYRKRHGTAFPESLSDQGRANAIYGNRITNSNGLAIQFPFKYTDDGEKRLVDGYGPASQAVFCGNMVEGGTHGHPEKSCARGVPTSDRIGHLGGDSPWGN